MGQVLGVVKSLFRYPVKSMAGERLERLDIGSNGVPGDRAWAVRDDERGGVRGGKRFPELMTCAARYAEAPAATGSSPAEITLPDGRSFSTGDPALPAALSQLVGGPVSFWPLMPADMLDHYRRGAPVEEDFTTELRRMFGRAESEPLPDFSVFPPELLEFESPPGTYFDAFPLLLMTQRALDSMSAAHPGANFDVRRFRPNLLIASISDAPFPEWDWVGRTLRVGEATLKTEVRCPRCVMTTHGFADLPKDPTIMRALVRESGGELGVYATVVEPGAVAIGDELVASV